MRQPEGITYNELSSAALVPGLLKDFNRFQEVNYVWRIVDGKNVLVKNQFIENWDDKLKDEIVS